MRANYNHISPVGQLDAMACWAACLKFWYKAAMSVSKSQKKIIAKYAHLADEYDGMSNDMIVQIITDSPMYIESYKPASIFTAATVADGLRFGPVYIAYTETSSMTRHVNVIHGLIGTGPNARVNVMEPQVTEKADLTWTGAHQVKFLSEFNQHGEIFLGVK